MTRAACVFLLLCVALSSALHPSDPPSHAASRRAFVGRIPLVVAGLATTDVWGHVSPCRCASCVAPANAYERRDVGGADASATTKAMNDQAYETNNRLERSGMKLETSAEQSSALTAELSKYDYAPSSNQPKKSVKKSTKTTSTN